MDTFVPSGKLETLLLAATEDPGKRPAFYRQLLESDVYILGKLESGRTDLRLNFWRRDDDEMVLPVFTSIARLEESGKETQPYLKLWTKDLLALLKDNATILLNPGSACGVELGPELIGALREGNLFQLPIKLSLNAGDEVDIQIPSDVPVALRDALRSLFAEHLNVDAAYLAQISRLGSGEAKHFLVGIVTEEEITRIVAEVNLIAESILGAGPIIDLIQMGPDPISLVLRQQAQPFYVRRPASPN